MKRLRLELINEDGDDELVLELRGTEKQVFKGLTEKLVGSTP